MYSLALISVVSIVSVISVIILFLAIVSVVAIVLILSLLIVLMILGILSSSKVLFFLLNDFCVRGILNSKNYIHVNMFIWIKLNLYPTSQKF